MREAMAEYDEAIRRNPMNRLAYYHRGTAYLDLGQYQPALNDYSEAIRVSPGDAEVYAARAFCYALLTSWASIAFIRSNNSGIPTSLRPVTRDCNSSVNNRSELANP